MILLPPDPQLSPALGRIDLAFNLAIGLSMFGLAIQEYIRVRSLRRLEAEATRAEAAERISATLCWLSTLDDRERLRACRRIVADMTALVDMALDESARCAFLLRNVHAEAARDKRLIGAIVRARREAKAIHSTLKMAAVCLPLGMGLGYRLTLEAVERYVRGFTPAVREIHSRGRLWRREILLFEIRMPDLVSQR